MPPEYNIEALKAQAVVARTYLYQKIAAGGHGDADICDNAAHCQAYYSTEKILEIWKKSKGWDKETRDIHAKKVAEAVEQTEKERALSDKPLRQTLEDLAVKKVLDKWNRRSYEI